mmetsp:Transcript_42057/g.136487  ORF Transcript_42057/g.136487 Transcript_42057/m.136487 type:complete len:98 (+) Transcript_42057:235-528(+)
MVLQLQDVTDPDVYLGAALHGAEAETFFSGLPPCDLDEGAYSLAALRRRVEAMCAAPSLEFLLLACRPPPEGGRGPDPHHQGVAFHVARTELHWHSG